MSELLVPTQLEDVSIKGAAVLEANVTRAEGAVAVGKKILAAIAETGMTPELDERCNKYLVNCRTAKNEMETERKPITSLFDTIRKNFTEAEGKVDVTKPESEAAKIQGHRNAYVQKLREEELKKQAEQQKKIDTDNEKIEIKASIEKQLSEYLQAHTLTRKQNLQSSFNSITLDTFAERSKALKDLKPTYKEEHYHAFSPIITPKHCTPEEVQQIKIAFMQSQDYHLLASIIESDLLKFKNELAEKLPSLKTQLEEMAKAGQEEQQRLAKEKADREKREHEEMERQAAEKARQEQEAIEAKKTSEQTEALMENLSVSDEGNAPESRNGYKITVLHPGAILEIVNFWFQKEGHQQSIPDLEKRTVAQMITFCQNHAHKTGEMIVSNKLTYAPVFKAVNRK